MSRNAVPQSVQVFIAYLEQLALEDWVGAALTRPKVPYMTPAEEALGVVIRQCADHASVFATRQAALDVLQRFESTDGRRLTRRRHVSEHLRPVTEHAALAIHLRDEVGQRVFEILYAPFESAIPVELVQGAQS